MAEKADDIARREQTAQWFAELRDRICAEFEKIEDEHSGQLSHLPPGRFARIPWSRAAEEVPGRLRQQIGFTIAAAQQEYEGIFGQILHGVLPGGGDHVRRLDRAPNLDEGTHLYDRRGR